MPISTDLTLLLLPQGVLVEDRVNLPPQGVLEANRMVVESATRYTYRRPEPVTGGSKSRPKENGSDDLVEKITSLAKRRGFVFPSSEIYGGAGATWDFGPLGVELKRNVKDAWWRTMVQLRDDVVGLDGAILMHPRVWEASGHVENFTDPLVECRNCRKRFRLDDLPKGEELAAAWRAKKLDLSGVPCPNCG